MVVGTKRSIVLVVEDDPALRQVYRATLAMAGYAVTAVEDGLDALRVLDQGTVPSAMVLDIGLPRLDGHALRRELHAHLNTRDIPIVVVTGADTRITESDFFCVLRKPIDAEALVHAVAKCLGKVPRR